MGHELKKTEVILKKWANVFSIAAVVLVGLSTLAALIVFGIDVEEFWWIALTIFAGGFISALPVLFLSHMVLGFAEIVESTKKIANGTKATNNIEIGELPEL